jgi:hypothetical protein
LVLTESKNNIFTKIGSTKKIHGPNSRGTSCTQRPSTKIFFETKNFSLGEKADIRKGGQQKGGQGKKADNKKADREKGGHVKRVDINIQRKNGTIRKRL